MILVKAPVGRSAQAFAMALFPVRLLLAGLTAGILASAAAAAAAPTPGAALSEAERSAIVQTLRADGQSISTTTDDSGVTAAILSLARTELGQRIRPAEVDRLWSIQPPRRDVSAEFEAARARGQLVAWLQGLSPPYAQYANLEKARARYQAMVGSGGWSPLPKGPAPRDGRPSPLAAALRARLAAEGYAAPATAAADVFDPGLRAALVAFQGRHGLAEDGVLGPATRAALDVPAQVRLDQIDANLERWRWVPRSLPADRLEIDIAGAHAALFRAGAPTLTMRIIDGDPRHPTPMFASRLEAVIFNPPWIVPTSIARNEILPKAARNPGYLARNDFTYVNGRLIQRPGPKNSLGQIKFDLPSPFGVYLHDTPSRSLFQRPVRALSHGCMRLEKPRELALALLASQGWTGEAIDQAIAAGTTRRVELTTQVPLYVFYWTATADADGEASFRPDVYGWDRKLIQALCSAPERRAALPQAATDCKDAPSSA